MNELDLDKLLSMEDPLPKPKPEPEQQTDVPPPPPAEPEVPAAPETKPRLTNPQRFAEIFCLALLVVMGISVGIWWRNRPQPNPVPPTTTVPNQGNTAPQLQLAGSIVYEDGDVICTQFSESLPLSLFYIGFTDDGIAYRMGLWDDAFANIGTDRFNTWLRLELTETGKANVLYGGIDVFCDGVPHVPDIKGTYLGIIPYYRQDTGALAGWFIQGWIERMVTLELKSKQLDTPTLFSLTLAPSLPTGVEELYESQLAYESQDILCYAYSERVDVIEVISIAPDPSQIAVWDGAQLRIPKSADIGMEASYNIYNVWLRIELTGSGKETLSSLQPQLRQGTAEFMFIPYRSISGEEMDGWFLLARIDHALDAFVTFDGLDLFHVVPLAPVTDSINIKYYTTSQLLDLIFDSDTLWQGKLPITLEANLLLKNLLLRIDNIEMLLDRISGTPDIPVVPEDAEKATKLLNHIDLYSKMTQEQLYAFLRLTGQYFQTESYIDPPQIITYPHTGTVIFEDKHNYWVVAPQTPAALDGIPHEELNCFIRVIPMAHTREQYGDDLTLTADDLPATMGIRAYYDESGLAGWFVYGKLQSAEQIHLSLHSSGGMLQAMTVSAIPIAENRNG